ncbi:hypothetical protein FCN77_21890 [Arthrobacter sp. 24S4-2]|uniref:hypothetical protein n=1 Tax=Arthrobacter sp. 24S4-2 TaxID=2575374 RepID=UPI0010C77E51|nr:hypothetical protein [Arthrobacter sp. 24S4-2]QCO99877.1 hypothetical protein FCN77_21890 [Arthrobacter sp. 24S4-2]
MKAATASIIAGAVLLLAGVLLLLDSLRVLDSGVLVWPFIFGAAGGAFLAVFSRSRANWWAAIPGFVLLGLAAVIIATELWPGSAGDWPGTLFFLFIAAGFAAVYFREHDNWWALIPCGVMLTLALVVALPPGLDGTPVASVLFLGLAATFATLAAIPERMKWPLIPAAVLAVLGLSFAIQSTVAFGAMDYITAFVPLVAGLCLLYYAFHSRRQAAHGQGRAGTDPMKQGLGDAHGGH